MKSRDIAPQPRMAVPRILDLRVWTGARRNLAFGEGELHEQTVVRRPFGTLGKQECQRYCV
jgi:hypothetical protein